MHFGLTLMIYLKREAIGPLLLYPWSVLVGDVFMVLLVEASTFTATLFWVIGSWFVRDMFIYSRNSIIRVRVRVNPASCATSVANF